MGRGIWPVGGVRTNGGVRPNGGVSSRRPVGGVPSRRGGRPDHGLRRVGARAGAFTLIELLIVIAIIAIMTAASMTVITAPPRDRALAQADAAALGGFATLMPRLVADAHDAATLTPTADGFALTPRDAAAPAITYRVDEAKRLRRETGAGADAGAKGGPVRGAALIPGVTKLSATPADPATPGLWKIELAMAPNPGAATVTVPATLLISTGGTE